MVRGLCLTALVGLSTKVQWGVPHYSKSTIAIVQLSSITGKFILNVTEFKIGLKLECKQNLSLSIMAIFSGGEAQRVL